MLQPVSGAGKLFKKYLLAKNHPSKVRLQNWAGKYIFKRGVVVQNEEGTMLALKANDWMTRIILLQDGYEKMSLNLAKKLLHNGGVCIDVGANFGLYTCILSHNKSAKIYAVEPNYMVLPLLLENVALNKRNNVEIVNTALGDGLNFLSLNLGQTENLGTASFNKENISSFSILSCSLNYLFESYSLKEVALMKIDIEGSEFDVLKNFSFEKYCVKNILLEFDQLSNVSLDDLCIFFSEKGFEIMDVSGKPINGYTTEILENNLWISNTNNV